MISEEAVLTAVKWFFGTGGTLTGGALGIRFIVKQMTDGKLDRARGNAVASSYQQLLEENKMLRDAAQIAYRERDDAIKREAAAVSTVGRLEERVSNLTEQVQMLNLRVEELMQRQERNGGEQWQAR